MLVRFEDPKLEELERNADCKSAFSHEIVKLFRKRMRLIREALDERDLYALKSLHFEKLAGNLNGFYSVRLNIQWRLLLKLEKGKNGKIVAVVSICDYH